jgi:tetratricopeptide (TPR) repeat protein
MHLTNELLHELETPGLSLNERALLRCQLARQFERASDYEAAEEAMKELWQGVGARPMLDGLDDETKARVLLRVGSLTGWIGGANQIEGSQEMAKDLISESATAFENLGQRNKVGEARSELGLCYWREGAFGEARITLQQALDEFEEADLEQRAIALLRWGIVERTSGRLNEALRVYNEAATLFDQVTDDLLTAQFHHAFANALKHLVESEKREDYADRAFLEYTAASYHFERAGHIRYQACVENNIGSLLGIIGKYEDAHEHLDQAQMIVTRLKDSVHLAQFGETRARVLLAEGRNVEAEKTARAAVLRLEKGEELSLLAEALTTHGIALARLAHSDQARAALERAIDVAERAGDFESAGVSALTIIEELGASLSNKEVWATIDHAGVLLEKSEDKATLRRLANAFRSLFLTQAMPTPSDWKGFSFWDAIHRYEGHLIKLALRETRGKVTAASRLLGLNHHQSLIALIASRHKDLIETGARAPVRPRRQHLMPHPKRKPKQSN